MALLDRFKKKRKSMPQVEWEEIKVEEVNSPPPRLSSDREIDHALRGRMGILETRSLLVEFTAQGWDKVSSRIEPMVLGQSLAAPWVLGDIFAAFPQESAVYLERYKEIPHKILILLLAVVGKDRPDAANEILVAVVPEFLDEDLPGALELLGRFPSPEGNKLLSSYLDSGEWTVVMKAAAALEAAGAVEYLPKMKEVQGRGGILESALGEIIQRMA